MRVARRTATVAPETSAAVNGGAVGSARPVLPPAPRLAIPKRQPKRLMMAGGVLVVAVAALSVYWVSQKSTQQEAVVALARDVAWGQQIQPADLEQVKIAVDPGLAAVSWAREGSLVGKYAASKLWAGTLLSANSVTAEQVLGAGTALIGLSVKAGQMPMSPLQPGEPVELVTVPAQDAAAAAAAAPVSATVYRTSGGISGGFVPVDVIVPQAVAARLATDSAAGRIVVVLLPAG